MARFNKINTSIHVTLYAPCVLTMLYCTPSTIGLALDRCLAMEYILLYSFGGAQSQMNTTLN